MIGLRFFPLKSADVRGAGTRDEPLRTSTSEAKSYVNYNRTGQQIHNGIIDQHLGSEIKSVG